MLTSQSIEKNKQLFLTLVGKSRHEGDVEMGVSLGGPFVDLRKFFPFTAGR